MPDNMRVLHDPGMRIALCCSALAALIAPIQAASLVLIMDGDGPFMNRLDVNQQGPATAGDVLTASQTDSGSGQGQFGQPAVSDRSAQGRAAFGNLGGQISYAVSGDYIGNPTARGYVYVGYSDTVSYLLTSGTVAYLEASFLIEGSGDATNWSSWYGTTSTILGFGSNDASFYSAYGCFPDGDVQSDLRFCEGRAGLNSSLSPSGAVVSRTVRIPIEAILGPNPSSTAFGLSSILEVSVDVWMTGNRPPSTSAQVNYFNSSLLGGFKLLDADFNVLSAQFSSASGFDYTRSLSAPSSAVPEPASVLLAGFGLLGIWGLQRAKSGV
jgi:hypothetical protein